MSVLMNEVSPFQPEAFYQRYFPALVLAATSTFNIPEDEAEELAEEILVTSLRKLATIEDVQGWLLGALQAASETREVR